ncbi:hypothetical protein MKY30_05650 [Oceanobacillus sp. FSL W8-0428]
MNKKENFTEEEDKNIAQWIKDRQNNQSRFIDLLSDLIQSSYSSTVKEEK